jgi:hypothetical protein
MAKLCLQGEDDRGDGIISSLRKVQYQMGNALMIQEKSRP